MEIFIIATVVWLVLAFAGLRYFRYRDLRSEQRFQQQIREVELYEFADRVRRGEA